MMNRRKQSKLCPYRLETNGNISGCFSDHPYKLLEWIKSKGIYYRLFLNETLVDES